ncbi:hypothetical protein [Roseateles sp. LYH14W]|uniref:DUF4034 domain-containing protein n=1 Tax=Pelomonas parva TaxID=3299032 RepID=A0ABW7F2W4_9BURK
MALRPTLLAFVLALAQGVAVSQSPPAAPAPLADTIEDQAAEAMFWGDWAEVERLRAASLTEVQRAQEGGHAACLFGVGADRSYNGNSQAYHEAKVAATLDWARRRPDSPLAHAMHLDALVDQAWFYRGAGYAKTVSDQRFADFRAKLNEALTYAKTHGVVMGRDNYYIRPLLTLLRGLDVSLRQQLEIARKGMRKDAFDECIHNRSLESLMPKWGGEPEQLESWVRESMKGLPDGAALMRYARSYNIAAESDYEQKLFEDSLARWPLMRDGLRQLINESPKSRYWQNRLAYFACMVKDREVAVPALEAIEAAPKFEAWDANGQQTYQSCRRWALQS